MFKLRQARSNFSAFFLATEQKNSFWNDPDFGTILVPFFGPGTLPGNGFLPFARWPRSASWARKNAFCGWLYVHSSSRMNHGGVVIRLAFRWLWQTSFPAMAWKDRTQWIRAHRYGDQKESEDEGQRRSKCRMSPREISTALMALTLMHHLAHRLLFFGLCCARHYNRGSHEAVLKLSLLDNPIKRKGQEPTKQGRQQQTPHNNTKPKQPSSPWPIDEKVKQGETGSRSHYI